MKTKSILLVLSSLVFLTSCTPSDKQIATDEQRANLYNNPEQRRGTSRDASGKAIYRFGSYGITAFLMEKQGEVLQLLSATGLEKDQSRGAYLVDSTSVEPDNKVVNLVAQDFSTTSDVYTYSQTSNWEVKVKSSLESASVESIQAQLKLGSTAVSKMVENSPSATPNSVLLTENSATINVTSIDSSLKQVEYSATGILTVSVMPSADGKEVAITDDEVPFTLKITLQVVTNDFKEENLIIKSARAEFNLARPTDPKFYSIVNKEDQVFKNTDCPMILGSATIEKDKNNAVALMTDSVYNVATKKNPSFYRLPNLTCGQRPIVDLSRLIIYSAK